MADNFTFETLSSSDTDFKLLNSILEDDFHMPDNAWWQGVEKSFTQLQSILGQRHNEVSSDEDPDSISASLARVGASPVVTLLKSGTHALRLTTKDEDLQCIAFGTISPRLYLEIFWEAVVKSQEEGKAIEVYKIDESRGCFWFQFEDHKFWLLYVQSEDLVRRFVTATSLCLLQLD